MTLKLLKIRKLLFSLFLICNLAKAQNVSESINVGETNISSNFSVEGVNPEIISLKAKAALYQATTVNRAQGASTIQVTPVTALITGYIL